MVGKGVVVVHDLAGLSPDIQAITRRVADHGFLTVIGFCLGGALVVAPEGFDVAAPFYPSIPPRYDTLLDGACPIVASYGRRDRRRSQQASAFFDTHLR